MNQQATLCASVIGAGDIAQRVRTLPSLPEVVLQLVEKLQDANADIESIAHLMSMDQALSAQVLRLANSPFYGLSGRIGSIRDGINILGLGQVRALVLAAVMTAQFERLHGQNLHMHSFWRHGIACAVASRTLARAAGLDEATAFAAGLLHDMGRLALDSLYPQAVGHLIHIADHEDLPIHRLELRHFGVSHTDVGAWLARHWHFDPGICNAIAAHHEPAETGELGLADVVHVADAIAHALDLCGEAREVVPDIRTSAWDKLRLDPQTLPEQLAQIEAEFEALLLILRPKEGNTP